MTNKLRSTLLASTLAAAVVAAGATTAFAGWRANYYAVSVSPGSMVAQGGLADTRATADTSSYIGCTTYSFPGQATELYCYARDAAGNYGGCFSYDAELVRAGQSINADGTLYFMWNAQGTCTYLGVTRSSMIAPKVN